MEYLVDIMVDMVTVTSVQNVDIGLTAVLIRDIIKFQHL